MKSKLLFLAASGLLSIPSAFAEIEMVANTTTDFTASQRVALFNGEAAMGSPQDGVNYRGAVHLYNWGNHIRTYELNSPEYDGALLGGDVAVSQNWLVAAAPRYGLVTGASQTNGYVGKICVAARNWGNYAQQMDCPIDGPPAGNTFSPEFNQGVYNTNQPIQLAIDENTLVVGYPGLDQVYVYQAQSGPNPWDVAPVILTPPDLNQSNKALFGNSVAIDDGVIVIGAPKAYDAEVGRIYVYEWDQQGGSWDYTYSTSSASAEPGGQYGFVVDIDDGHIVIGSRNGEVDVIEDKGWWSPTFNDNVGTAVTSVAIDNGFFAVSSLPDANGKVMKVTKTYKKEWQGWQAFGSKTPSLQSNMDVNNVPNQSELRFGSDIELHNSNLLISAPNFNHRNPSNPNDIVHVAGAMYLMNIWETAN